MRKLNSNYLIIVPFVLSSLIFFDYLRYDYYLKPFMLYIIALSIVGGSTWAYLKKIRDDWFYVWAVFALFWGIMAVDRLFFNSNIYTRFFSEGPRGVTDILFDEMIFRGIVPFLIFYLILLRRKKNKIRLKVYTLVAIIATNMYCFYIHILPFFLSAHVMSEFSIVNFNKTFSLNVLINSILFGMFVLVIVVKKWECVFFPFFFLFIFLFATMNISIISREEILTIRFETIITLFRLYLKYLWLFSGALFMFVSLIIKKKKEKGR